MNAETARAAMAEQATYNAGSGSRCSGTLASPRAVNERNHNEINCTMVQMQSVVVHNCIDSTEPPHCTNKTTFCLIACTFIEAASAELGTATCPCTLLAPRHAHASNACAFIWQALKMLCACEHGGSLAMPTSLVCCRSPHEARAIQSRGRHALGAAARRDSLKTGRALFSRNMWIK
jgi:hypothetical protein